MALEILDIGMFEERVYQELCGRVMSAEELASALNADLVEVRAAVDSLSRRGLVSAASAGAIRAAPPDVAVEALVRRRQEQLEGAKQALAALVEIYRRPSGSDSAPELVEMVLDVEAAGVRWRQLQRSASGEVLLFNMPPDLPCPNRDEIESSQLEAGIRYRVIYGQSALRGDHLRHVRAMSAAGEEARVHDDLPLKMAIVDGRTALIPLNAVATNLGDGVILVRKSVLLDALVALFEESWRASIPMPTSPGRHQPADVASTEGEADVLHLMAGGLTDEAIGARLGVSARTVRRRIRSMMDTTGASSRFQFGWLARELSGWQA